MYSIRIETNKPVAIDSPDHKQPWGTARDNSVNASFNKKLLWWIPTTRLRVLDLGCAGGGFVKSILDKGSFAVGIEGSDYSKRRSRAEWETIPNYLFTADITEPFNLFQIDKEGHEDPMRFNVITLWEVIEHIHEDKLGDVFENVARHLLPHGVVILSISPNEEMIQGVKLHQTVKGKEWWIRKFLELGFMHHEQTLHYFRDDFVRGGSNAPGSFHAVLTKYDESLLFEYRLRLLIILVRLWSKTWGCGKMLWNKVTSTISHVKHFFS